MLTTCFHAGACRFHISTQTDDIP